MSSTECEPPSKAVPQGGRPLRRQATGVPVPTGSRPKSSTVSRRLRKERSMRIPAIENDMMNRIGITRKSKARVRASSPKATISRTRTSPYKTLLVGIARTGTQPTSDAVGSAGESSGSSVNLVRCASPESTALPSNTPLPPKQPVTATGTAETKGKKKSNTPQSSIVLRPLPSRVAARSPLSRVPLDAPTRVTRSSSGASPSLPPDSYLPRKRPPLARSPLAKNSTSAPAPMATAQPAKVGVSTSFTKSSGESDSQSDDLSISDATSDVRTGAPDASAAGIAQAAAIKQSLLSQIEERNEGKKWDDLLGFFHNLAPSEVGGLLKTATRAGRRAFRRFAGKETVEPGPSNRENDARVLNRARQPRRQGESVLRFEDAGSDGEGEVTNQTVVPPRQRQFLYKAKGKARARSPSPPLLSSPSPPVFDSQMGGASTSASTNGLVVPKRARTPEEDDHDDGPPMKRRNPRPLVREGAFYEYPTLSTPAQPDSEDAEPPQTTAVHVNLLESFLDHVQDLNVSSWLPRVGTGGDPFATLEEEDEDEDEDEWAESSHIWSLGAAARRRRSRRADGGVESDDAMPRGMSNSAAPWT